MVLKDRAPTDKKWEADEKSMVKKAMEEVHWALVRD